MEESLDFWFFRWTLDLAWPLTESWEKYSGTGPSWGRLDSSLIETMRPDVCMVSGCQICRDLLHNVVVWMWRAPIASYVWTLGSQLLERNVALLEEVCWGWALRFKRLGHSPVSSLPSNLGSRCEPSVPAMMPLPLWTPDLWNHSPVARTPLS